VVYSTAQAARLLGVQPGTLGKALWNGRIPAPPKSPSNTFLWSEADVQRAARVRGCPAPKFTTPGAAVPAGGVGGKADA